MSIIKDLDGIQLELLEEYFVNGTTAQMPEELVRYLELMELMYGRLKRWDTGTRKNHIGFFMAPPYSLNKMQAEKLHQDTMEFFYVEENVSLQAYANYYAQKLESLANASIELLSGDKSLEVAGKLLQMAMETRAKYRPEEPAFPDEILKQRHIIFQDNKRLLGEAMTSRKELAALIDSWELSDDDKERLKAEALVTEPKLFADEPPRT